MAKENWKVTSKTNYHYSARLVASKIKRHKLHKGKKEHFSLGLGLIYSKTAPYLNSVHLKTPKNGKKKKKKEKFNSGIKSCFDGVFF